MAKALVEIFVFPRFSADLNSNKLSKILVDQAGVAVSPGVGFRDSGEPHFRIALMRSPADRVIEGALG